MKRFTLADLPANAQAEALRQLHPHYVVGHAGFVPNNAPIKDESESLWDMYQKLGSVHRVGEVIGVHGQTVKNRLNKAGYRLNNAAWTDAEADRIKEYYSTTTANDFSIQLLADSMKRSFAAVALKASRLGLTRKRTDQHEVSKYAKASASKAQKERVKRVGAFGVAAPLLRYVEENGSPAKGTTHSEEFRKGLSERAKAWHANNPHPRGMLGKKHGQAAKDAISKFHTGRKLSDEHVAKMMRTRAEKGNACRPRPEASWKSGWVDIGGKRFYSRSRWEANYARYLQWQKERGELLDWEHEPKTFWFEGIKRGCMSYLPDFLVKKTAGEEYHEVKGWMDDRSITKINRMAKYHPDVKLVVIDSPRYKALAKSLKNIVPDWQ